MDHYYLYKKYKAKYLSLKEKMGGYIKIQNETGDESSSYRNNLELAIRDFLLHERNEMTRYWFPVGKYDEMVFTLEGTTINNTPTLVMKMQRFKHFAREWESLEPKYITDFEELAKVTESEERQRMIDHVMKKHEFQIIIRKPSKPGTGRGGRRTTAETEEMLKDIREKREAAINEFMHSGTIKNTIPNKYSLVDLGNNRLLMSTTFSRDGHPMVSVEMLDLKDVLG